MLDKHNYKYYNRFNTNLAFNFSAVSAIQTLQCQPLVFRDKGFHVSSLKLKLNLIFELVLRLGFNPDGNSGSSGNRSGIVDENENETGNDFGIFNFGTLNTNDPSNDFNDFGIFGIFTTNSR